MGCGYSPEGTSLGHEGRALWVGLMPLWKRPQVAPLWPPSCEDTARIWLSVNWKRLCPRLWIYWHLDLGLPASRTVRTQGMLLISSSHPPVLGTPLEQLIRLTHQVCAYRLVQGKALGTHKEGARLTWSIWWTSSAPHWVQHSPSMSCQIMNWFLKQITLCSDQKMVPCVPGFWATWP